MRNHIIISQLLIILFCSSATSYSQPSYFTTTVTTADVTNVTGLIRPQIPPVVSHNLVTPFTFNRAFGDEFADIISSHSSSFATRMPRTSVCDAFFIK